MITNYDKFKNEKLNEGLWDSLKNLFSKLLQGVSEQIQKPVDELNKKLNSTKDPKQLQVIMPNYLKVHNNTLTTQLKTTKTLPELKQVVVDNLSGIYAAVTAASQTLGKDTFTFTEIFGESTPQMKKLFDGNDKNFKKYVPIFTTDLIVATAAQFPSYNDKNATKEKVNASGTTNTNEKEQINKAVQTPATDNKTQPAGEMKPGTKVEPANNANSSLIIQETERLNEEAEPKPVDPKVEAADFEKLKKSMKNWFDLSVYKKLNDTLNGQKDAKPAGTLEDKIKNIKSTTHPESVTAIADALTKADKQTLMKVRDLLGLDVKSAPL